MACYWHSGKRLICFLMFVLVVLSLMETSGIHGRKLPMEVIVGKETEVQRLGALAAMLPRGSVPPSGPSSGIN